MSGEFAGYALDESIDAENDRWIYRQGMMSDSHAYELGIIDNYGRYSHVPMFKKQQSKTCKHCGVSSLKWVSTEKGWRLSGALGIHMCNQYKR